MSTTKKSPNQDFRDNIPVMPNDWEGLPLQLIAKKLYEIKQNGKPVVPNYGRYPGITWDNIEVLQQKKLAHGWNIITPPERRLILAEVKKKVETGVSSDNWNGDDWCRLGHLFADARLLAVWTRTMHVLSVLFFLDFV